jgi:hypothetical protein
MKLDNVGNIPRDDEGAPWVECEECGLLEHPDLTCDDAAALIRARNLRELLSRHRALMLAALEDAAADRMERADVYCVDCARSERGRCATHQGDLDRAAEYRRTFDALAAAFEG